MGARVSSIEIRPQLADRAATVLADMGITDVNLHIGNGFDGIIESAPYDRIIVTASPNAIPVRLVEQLVVNGEMLIPVGERSKQMLTRVRRRTTGWEEEALLPVLFVPMTGQH